MPGVATREESPETSVKVFQFPPWLDHKWGFPLGAAVINKGGQPEIVKEDKDGLLWR